MHKKDIIFYGMDLLDYTYQEFGAGRGLGRSDFAWQPCATVPFRSELVG